jgi:hypothetical protein
MHPTSMVVVTVSILAVGGLAAMDWYVWGMAKRPHFHSPRLVRPLSVRELADKFLSGIVASNTEVLMVPITIAKVPDAIAKAPNVRVIGAITTEVGHGFKEVA